MKFTPILLICFLVPCLAFPQNSGRVAGICQDAEAPSGDRMEEMIGVLSGNLFKAFPDVGREYNDKSTLERKAFLKTKVAEDLRSQLAGKRSEMLSKTYSIILATEMPEYETGRNMFVLATDQLGSSWTSFTSEEQAYWNTYLGHVLKDKVWFDGLPLRLSLPWGFQELSLKVPETQALEIERHKSTAQTKICFGLTGNVRSLTRNVLGMVYSDQFLEAKNPTAVILNSETGEVLWSKSFLPSAAKKR